MGLKFRKSIKIAPGVKVNIGKKSVGVSVGGKYGGVSVNSKTGARARVSAPGTGLSYSQKIGKADKVQKSSYMNNNELNIATLTSDELMDYGDQLIENMELCESESETEYYTQKLEEVNAELEKRGNTLQTTAQAELKKLPNWFAITMMILGIITILIIGIPLFTVNIIAGFIPTAIGIFMISVYFKNKNK